MSKPDTQLDSNALGLLTTAALTAAYMAPALSVYALFGPMVGQAGIGVGFVMLLALLMTLPSAVSFGMLAREMPSAGGVYAWASRALGSGAGIWAGITTATYYVLTVFFPPIVFGQFLNELLARLGVAPSTWTLLGGALLALALTGAVTYRGIVVSSRLAFAMLMTELAVVVALGATFLVLAAVEGRFTWAPVAPPTTGSEWAAVFAALPMALLAMVCDAATPTSEETRDARRTIPLAVVTTCVLIGVWYVVGFSAFALAAPREEILRLAAEPDANIAAPLAERAWGAMHILVTITGMTAALGALVPCSTAASRVLFAMGRDGTLPRWLSAVHPRYKAPWNAFHVVYLTTIVAVSVVALAVGANQTVTWWGNVVGWYIATVYILANLSNVVFHRRFGDGRLHLVWNLLVPLVGIAAPLLVVWQQIIVGMSRKGWFGRSGQVFIVVATLASALYAYRRAHANGADGTGLAEAGSDRASGLPQGPSRVL